MSHFLIHAARMQDAGVKRLDVSLGARKDGTRMMYVSPDMATPRELADRFPARAFELCGTDRVLERLQDDMSYSADGVTPEKVAAAIAEHPLLRDDLCEFLADHMLLKASPEVEADAAADSVVDDAMVDRCGERLKGMLRGLDIARQRDAMKQPAAPQEPQR